MPRNRARERKLIIELTSNVKLQENVERLRRAKRAGWRIFHIYYMDPQAAQVYHVLTTVMGCPWTMEPVLCSTAGGINHIHLVGILPNNKTEQQYRNILRYRVGLLRINNNNMMRKRPYEIKFKTMWSQVVKAALYTSTYGKRSCMNGHRQFDVADLFGVRQYVPLPFYPKSVQATYVRASYEITERTSDKEQIRRCVNCSTREVTNVSCALGTGHAQSLTLMNIIHHFTYERQHRRNWIATYFNTDNILVTKQFCTIDCLKFI